MKKREATFLAAAAAFTLFTVPAVATDASSVTGVVVARGDFADPVDIKFKVTGGNREVIHAPNARETVMQTIVIGPDGHTGWHSHPGPVVVLVKSGELTLYSADDCTGRTYTMGQAFIDQGQGHAHIGRNLSAGVNTELWVTYFDVPPVPPPGVAFRIDAADPGNCAPF